MPEKRGDGPSDEELIRFAGRLLGAPLAAEETLLRDAVRQARDLWLLLYEIDHNRPNDDP